MAVLAEYKAPFPYFGGKSRIASEVWGLIGNVPNYVEPFFGSGAVFFLRPHEPGIETVNDAYRIRGTAGGDTYAPTLDTSLSWGVGLDAFPGSTAGIGARCDGLLPVLGVGG